MNGACLTVTEFDKTEKGGWFKVWLANETLERTDLGECDLVCCCSVDEGVLTVWNSMIGERKVDDQVNLERAMGAHVRFGGHFVQVRPSFRLFQSHPIFTKTSFFSL